MGKPKSKYAAKRTQSSSCVSPFKRARLHALSTTVRSGYSSVPEKIRDLRDWASTIDEYFLRRQE